MTKPIPPWFATALGLFLLSPPRVPGRLGPTLDPRSPSFQARPRGRPTRSDPADRVGPGLGQVTNGRRT
jgi:hypothetical protein